MICAMVRVLERTLTMKRALLLTLLLTGCMNPNDPDTRNCLIRSMCLDIAANRGNGDPALLMTILNMGNQANNTTQSSLSELGHNLAIIGAGSQPLRIQEVHKPCTSSLASPSPL